MSHYATYSYPIGADRYEIRFQIGGDVDLTIYGPNGKVAERCSGEIDPRDSHRIVTDLFAVAGAIPPDAFGDRELGVSDGATSRVCSLSEYHLSARGLEVARIIHVIATDIRAGYAPRSSSRNKGGPAERRVGPVEMVKWTVYFALIFFAAQAIKLLLVAVGIFGGILGFAISATISLFVPFLVYYRLGEAFGHEYRGNAEVLLPAFLGTALVYGVLIALNPFNVLGLFAAITLPIAAKKGQLDAY